MTGGIFVNYRVGDEENTAALVASKLAQEFGAANVFRASTSIRPSEVYDQKILTAVRKASILLAIIGPRWLTSADACGANRIAEAGDWVRREIAEALARDVLVVPVLVGAATLPLEAALPSDIRGLAKRQYLRLHYRSMDPDVSRLVEELASLAPELGSLRSTRSGIQVSIRVDENAETGHITAMRDTSSRVTDASITEDVRINRGEVIAYTDEAK